jgi:molybdenum cofactor cytidylyltransferase
MIVGILLAAGKSKRFGKRLGQNKQLAMLADGRSMLETSATTLRTVVGNVVIVVRDQPLLITHASDIAGKLDCQIVINAHADDGMASSIAAGVRFTADADGWLIAMGDMPFIQAQTIRTIEQTLALQSGIVVPTYAGKNGHPVGFARAFFDDLCNIEGDVGAREVINRYPEKLMRLDTDDQGILYDIDTPAALNQFSQIAK